MAETAASDLSPAGFLAWEEAQAERFERVGGVVHRRAGGTLDHDTIGNNIRALLWTALRGKPCRSFGPDMKVVTPGGDLMYPDALVRCGLRDGRATFVEDPIVVVEVLSESTAEHDLTRKRLAYKTIPSLEAIVYVGQRKARVDLLRRDADGRWDDGEPAEGLDAVLDLPEIDVRLRLADIYEDTDLARPPSEPSA